MALDRADPDLEELGRLSLAELEVVAAWDDLPQTARQAAQLLRQAARRVPRKHVARRVGADLLVDGPAEEQRLPASDAVHPSLVRAAPVDDSGAQVGQGRGLLSRRPVPEERQ